MIKLALCNCTVAFMSHLDKFSDEAVWPDANVIPSFYPSSPLSLVHGSFYPLNHFHKLFHCIAIPDFPVYLHNAVLTKKHSICQI